MYFIPLYYMTSLDYRFVISSYYKRTCHLVTTDAFLFQINGAVQEILKKFEIPKKGRLVSIVVSVIFLFSFFFLSHTVN